METITDIADSLCFSVQNIHRACVMQKMTCQKFAQTSNAITRHIYLTQENVTLESSLVTNTNIAEGGIKSTSSAYKYACPHYFLHIVGCVLWVVRMRKRLNIYMSGLIIDILITR